MSLNVIAELNLNPSYKHDMKSQCHTSMKLAKTGVTFFTCEHKKQTLPVFSDVNLPKSLPNNIRSSLPKYEKTIKRP